MRFPMSTRVVPAGLAVLAGTLIAPWLAAAQPQQNRPFPFQPQNNPVQDVDQPRIADVNFPGGTVQAYIDYLRTVSPDNVVNAVVTDDLGKATIPAVRLRNVTSEQAVRIIDGLLSERRDVQIDELFSASPAGSQVVSMRFQRSGNPYQDNPSPIAIFQINDIVAEGKDTGPLTSGSLPVNTVLTAIEQAMKMIGGTPPEVKYHADSGLLLLKGAQPQTDAASQVLNSLRESAGKVDGMGGGKWTRSWTLVNCDPLQVVRAFREVFPPGSDQSEGVKVVGEPNTNSVAITAPRNMAVAADVLVRYVDRPPQPNQELIAMSADREALRMQRDQLAARVQEADKGASDVRDRYTSQIMALQSELQNAQQQVDSLKSQLEALRSKK